jgi:uncharacterized protein
MGTDIVKIGPVEAKRGTKEFGFLPVAIGADGGNLGIGVHVLAGARPGPKVVVMMTSHGNEYMNIGGLMKLREELDLDQMSGDVVLIPVQNPVAFEMGARGTWMDGLWGDSGNLNRVWPGRANGWVSERIAHVISEAVLPGSTVVMDLHGPTREFQLSYGYLGQGKPGDLDYDLARAFGQELLVWNNKEALEEKRQTTSTAKAAVRLAGMVAVGGELGEFYGLPDYRAADPEGAHREPTEIGFTGITNVLKHLKMTDGEIKLPPRQIAVTPELNLRPKHGGLLISNMTIADLGTVVPKGTVLGTLVSPYSFEVLDEIEAPFEESLLLAANYGKPFTKVLPGEFVYIVADNSLTEVVG